MRALFAAVLWMFTFIAPAYGASDLCASYRTMLNHEAQVIYGVDPPTPRLIGQLRQESSCRDNVTAWDNGRGAAQFMDPTALWVSQKFPELGPPDPYSRKWAIRGMIRLNNYNEMKVQGYDECERVGAAIKGYNAGLGYVLQAQKASPEPKKWFGVTEHIPTRQSAQNFEYSRTYPHKILFKHQLLYLDWGRPTCANMFPNQKK